MDRKYRPVASSRLDARWVESLESRLLMARAFGIDVSDWQGTINWTQVASSGKTYAFIRATRGGTTGTYNESTRVGTLSERYDDTKFVTNITGAKAAGLQVGVYHFARPDIATNTGADDATHFLQVAGPYMTTGYLAPVLDLEAGSARSKTDLTDWALEFCQTIYDAKGVWPIVYVNSSYANSEVDSRMAQFPLWMARPAGAVDPATGNPPAASGLPNVYGVWNPIYPATPSPAPWDLWQYSSTGRVAGIVGNVDLDVFNGTLDQLKQRFVIGYQPPPDLSTALLVTVAADGGPTLSNGDTVDFGAALQKSAAPTITLQVKNVGTDPVNLSGLFAGTPFSITEGLSKSLKAGASDTFTISLNTATVATATGALSFNAAGGAIGTFTLTLQASIVAPPAASTQGAVYGFVYEDLNGNGTRDANEPGLPDRQVWLDANGNGIRDASDPVATTSLTGEYIFNNLPVGRAIIRPVITPAWYQSGPGPDAIATVSVQPKGIVRAKDYGLVRPASVSGWLYVDANRNGKRDPGESPLAGWTVFVDRNNNGKPDAGELQVQTDAFGFYLLNDLRPGTAIVRAVLQPGYVRTSPTNFVLNLFSGSAITDQDFGFRY